MDVLTDYHLQAAIREAVDLGASSPDLWAKLNSIAEYLALIGASTEAHAVWQFAYSGHVVIPEQTKHGDSSVTMFCFQHQLPDMSQGRPGRKNVDHPEDRTYRLVVYNGFIRIRLARKRPGPDNMVQGLALARLDPAQLKSPTEQEALPFLYRYLDEGNPPRADIVDLSLLCSEIECRAKNKDKGAEMLRRSYDNVGGLFDNWPGAVLGMAGTAGLCFHGRLSAISELAAEKRQAMVSTMIDRLSGKSKSRSRPKTWTVARWRKLLDEFQRAYVNKNIDYIEPGFTFQKAGATADEIADIEARLGLRLPPSYRTFLEATNGYADLGNAYPGEFFPADKVVRQGDIDEDIHFLIDEVPDPKTGIQITRKIASQAIRITAWGDVSILLLSPDMVTNDEWACLDYASWHPGIHVSPSFGDWFKRRLRGLKDYDQRMI